jgi:hypothetical protein
MHLSQRFCGELPIGAEMRIFRRVVMPVAWLAVFAVIAVALVKIAFVDGMKPEQALAGPAAQVAAPVIQATRATVTNKVQVKATVHSDAPVGVRNTAAGVVTHIFLAPGTKVTSGERLYQVRAEVPAEPATGVALDTTARTGQQGGVGARQPRTVASPTYTYTDVLAPASGELETLTVLTDQQVSVGDAAGTVNPGTFTVRGSVDAAQQYRLLAKPGSAQISVVGGPAPFTCASVALTSAAGVQGNAAGSPSGGVSRAVPYAAIPVPGGGIPEQGGTPTGTLSCAVPPEVEVFAGLGATMTVTAGEAVDVITVPLTSVEGSVKEGLVWLAGTGMTPDAGGNRANGPAGEPQQRKVQLGLNDGSMVEVVSGLDEGEAVLEFIPGAPAQVQPGPQFAGPGAVGG